jgi:nucleoside-diphosphate-sugar epimerase
MRNLVIGAPGFVAMALIEALLARGEGVRVIVQPGQATRRLAEMAVQVRSLPLTDNAGLMAALQGVERLYYADWSFRDWGVQDLSEGVAVRGLRNLLAAATRNQVARLIYLSTTDVYGLPEHPVDESEQLAPPGLPHADAKARAELLVWEQARRVRLPVTVLRPTSVYGPGGREFGLDLIERLRQRRMILVEEGGHVAGLTYVGNLADAMLLAAESEQAEGQAYNINDDSEATWGAYLQALAALAEVPPPRKSYSRGKALLLAWGWEMLYQLLGRTERPPLTRLMVEVMSVDQRYPIAKARRELGYRPRISLTQGLRAMADWLRQEGLVDW